MRKIKFRAWDLDNKRMDDHFFIQSNGTPHDVPSKTFDTPNIEIEENPNLIIMQFTGLTDKNGVDIYEGDIIKPRYNRLSAFEVKYLTGYYNASKFDVKDCDVIGNIHENKELLEC